MSRRWLALVAPALLILGGAALFWGHAPDEDRSHVADRAAQYFLADLDLDSGAYALLLHPVATRGEMRIVTDPEVIRRAKTAAFYEDARPKEQLLLEGATAFLTPPDARIDAPFVTIVRGKDIVRTYLCGLPHCHEPEHPRNLAGLLDASHLVELVEERFAHPGIAHTAHFRAIRRIDVPAILPVDLPSPSTAAFPHNFTLHLPPFFAGLPADSTEPREPVDEALYLARLKAAFAYVFPDAEAWRFGPLTISMVLPPPNGFDVVSDRDNRPVLNPDGSRLGLTGFVMYQPHLTVEVIPALAEAFTQAEAFDTMPAFTPAEPAALRDALDALAEEVLEAPCPGCFEIAAPVYEDGTFSVSEIAPVTYSISYFRMIRDEPTAQQ